MKILITGGAGYKGILLTEKLLNLGHKVTILDNFMYGYESILHLIKNKNLESMLKNIPTKKQLVYESDNAGESLLDETNIKEQDF